MADGTAMFHRNDIGSSSKPQVSGTAATLPLSLCEREQLCERSELTNAGEGAKPTYSQNMIRPLTLSLSLGEGTSFTCCWGRNPNLQLLFTCWVGMSNMQQLLQNLLS